MSLSRSLCLLILVALFRQGATGWATDPAAIATALGDTTAECRYLAQLCNRVAGEAAAMTTTTQVREQSTRRLREFEARGWDSDAERQAMRAEVTREQARTTVALRQYRAALTALSEAAEAIRAKHDTMPACFAHCPALDFDIAE